MPDPASAKGSGLEAAGEAADNKFSSKPADDPTLPCAQTSWVDIELLDADGNPITDEPYELLLPDGRGISGRLNGKGLTGVDRIDLGECEIRFPNMHPEAGTLEP